MVLTDKISFFNFTQHFDVVPYTQTEGMYEFHARSGINKIKFFVNKADQPTIACFAHEKSFGPIKMILIEGECFADSTKITLDDIRRFYKDLTLSGYDIVEVCSNSFYKFEYETALRQAGYLRPVGQFSMPTTKIIDLTSEVSYTRNWNQNIKKANKNELIFEPVTDIKLSDCTDFVKIYTEMTSRKDLVNSLSAEQFYALCSTGQFYLYFVIHGNKRIAGTIIHQRNSHAGSYYAATGNEALKLSASFFMYCSLLDYLKKNKFETFDMEKLVPSTKSVNSVFEFKNGIIGTFVPLNGEWSWYKKPYYRPLMYFVKKYLMKKREL